MNWLITGGCGFIGTALLARLVSEGGHNIRVVDNLSVGTREDLSQVTNFQELGLRDLQQEIRGVQLLVADILDAEIAVAASFGMKSPCCDLHLPYHLSANRCKLPSISGAKLPFKWDCWAGGSFKLCAQTPP